MDRGLTARLIDSPPPSTPFPIGPVLIGSLLIGSCPD